jgi:hypothetical protein
MNTSLKVNTRFSALLEDMKQDKVSMLENKSVKQYDKYSDSTRMENMNTFKRKSSYRDQDAKQYNEMRDKEKKRKEEQEKKRKEEELKHLFSNENFPTLLLSTPQISMETHEESGLSMFADKVKQQTPQEGEEMGETREILHPDWMELRKDPVTKKTVFTYGNPIYHPRYKDSLKKEWSYTRLQDLVNVYEKRKEEYIELWGYDMWESMHLFPNYDYEYFDKLDQQNEEIEEMEEEQEYSEGYISN